MSDAGYPSSSGGFPAYLFAALLWGLFFLLLCPQIGRAEGVESFSAAKPFSGLVQRGWAEEAAKVEAENTALAYAMRDLAALPEVQYAGSAGTFPEEEPLDLEALARAVFTTLVADVSLKELPEGATVQVSVILAPPAGGLRERVLLALRDRQTLELFTQAARMQNGSLSFYNELSPGIMGLPEARQGQTELGAPLERTWRRLKSLEKYFAFLAASLEGARREPAKSFEELTSALELDPANPLILTSLAEVYLNLDRPPAALEAVQLALEEAPWFARAHDVQGTAYLRLRLPALAAASFTRAIELRPTNADYHMHRASAYLVQEEVEPMCRDFHKACTLGLCEGLEWARETGKCPARGLD